MAGDLLCGALAGAAGTTALNAVTYADMALRGRPASQVPEQLVGTLTDPRTWSAADWLSDLVPHLAYGIVTAATYDRLTCGD